MWPSLIEKFGYLGIFAATIAEGGTALTVGGFLAHQGYLRLVPWVIVAGFLGSAVDGQLWFLLSRRYGLRLVEQRPRWQGSLARIDRLFRRHPSLLIVVGRFVPGARTAGWIAAGLSGIPRMRFASLNLLGAAVWAGLVSGSGYLFGRALHTVLGELERFELPIVGGIVAASLLWWMVWRLRQGRG